MIRKNPDTGKEETVIVVAGGSSPRLNKLSSSELLLVDHATSQWRKGPSLPRSVELATMLRFEDSLILFDGRFLFRLDDPFNGSWSQVPLNVTTPRSHQTAFLIPDSLADCS